MMMCQLSRRRRRAGIIVAAAALVAILLLAWHVGRFSAMVPWQEASGFDHIDTEARPVAELDSGPGISWLGHAGFCLDYSDGRLLLDPNLSETCSIARRRWAVPVSAAKLGPVAAVLISHAHRDHLDCPTLAGLTAAAKIIVPAGAERWLPPLPGTEIVTAEAFVPITVGQLVVTPLPAAHNGHRNHPFASDTAALSYLIEGDNCRLYWAGDTGFGNAFADIGKRYHPQLAILPIGSFSPRWPLARYHLNPEEAVAAAVDLGVQTVIPGHFGTFTLSLDSPDAALPRFARAAAAAGMPWYLAPVYPDVHVTDTVSR